ncbi:hypothetical protein HMPREF1624_08660 [Sporothrix schenckii ATCC 58251]|uniref:MINDY deubiquitinase domain-containing protein n=1 Tax=Sporothrix schenckii (strain ATCC 58251 / de Perez 2211183) TaxID=1391915 RepID=U7PJR2_SPOS1|nr:hypothetical protein HMPREF1624_08660 [Sporothrix schenckii ATCC 58251]
MVVRKPLPQTYDGTGSGSPGGVNSDSVPDVLRPGRNPHPNAYSPAPPSPYSNFQTDEQSAWAQPAPPAMPQGMTSQNDSSQQPTPQQQPPPIPTAVPTILLQSATGSSTASGFSETNPFKRKAVMSAESPVQSPAVAVPPLPSAPAPPPPPPPASQPLPPTTSFSQLSMDDQTGNPWQPTPIDSRRGSQAPIPVIPENEAVGGGENAWASQNATESPFRRPSPNPAASNRDSNLISFPPDEDADIAGWDEVASPVAAPGAGAASLPPPRAPFTPLNGKETASDSNPVFEDRNAWDDLGARSGQPQPLPTNLVTEPAGEGWNLVDNEPVPGQLSRQSTWENFTDDEEDVEQPNSSQAKPAKPPLKPKPKNKNKLKEKNVVPSVPVGAVDTSAPLISIDSPPPTSKPDEPVPAAAPTDSLQAVSQEAEEPAPLLPLRSMLDVDGDTPPRQPPRPSQSAKAETYQVKNISWYDVSASQNPRVSPILVQNANGPCPLVALVNALTLTTPADISTALVETLRSREQVSLSFLLDAVFDELMSSRRSSRNSDLPDVDELYKFLKGLHTGMNVNPRFIPTQQVITAFRRTSLTHLHPTERDDMIPGTFEDTREMQLYATFSIPLIHGWLPKKGDGAYEALSRQAASYEDVQNLLFREEELEEKLSSPSGDGLTEDEQQVFQDILEIKNFLHGSATQLTPFGLDIVAKAMRPGTFAILFRNDHFSTLYRHPQTMQLLSLVTDAGYASHDEVIWETLVDVNGEHAEFYSGDFRLVGNSMQQNASSRTAGSGSRHGGSASNNQNGWTTVRGRRQNQSEQHESHSPLLSNDELSRHEQEDRDLALALQLQEEEEEQQRADEAHRNSRLSEQFIEQNARPANQSRRPSNAAGGGRYNSSQPVPVSSRRSSAGFPPGSLLDSNPNHRRTSSSSASGSALGSTMSNGQRIGQYSSGRTPSRSPSHQQVVRPLVPPTSTSRVNTRPAVNRPADNDENDEAPPSYEQAAKLAPYHPPPGAPGSESAAGGRNSAAGSSSNLGGSSRASISTPSPRPLGGYATTSGRQNFAPGTYSAYQQQQAARSDRDCTIM